MSTATTTRPRPTDEQQPDTDLQVLWYIPNQVAPAIAGRRRHRDHNSLDTLDRAGRLALEDHGWDGALLGTGWGRPDTFTVATALAARTTTFQPLVAIRPGYWRPAHFASAAATLDHLSGGRLLVNIVSGQDNLAAYGDTEGDQAHRYARTREFLQMVRGCGPRRTSPTPASTSRSPGRRWRRGPSSAATAPHPAAVLRRRVRGRRAGGCDGGRRPAVLGRAAGRRRASGSSDCGRLEPELGREHATAGVRAADHHARPRHHRAGLGRRGGEGGRDGRGPGRSAVEPGFKAVGQQRLLDLAARGRGARRQPLHRAGQVRRRRRRHDLAGRVGGGRRLVAAQVPGPRDHPLRALRHAVPARDPTARATNCSRCCADLGEPLSRRLRPRRRAPDRCSASFTSSSTNASAHVRSWRG